MKSTSIVGGLALVASVVLFFPVSARGQDPDPEAPVESEADPTEADPAETTLDAETAHADDAADAAAVVALVAEEVENAAEAVPDFDEMRTPDSPAFVILGVSPTEIQRPTTPNELVIALGTFVSDDKSITIPQNFSLEVAPYWLFAHPSLTAKDYEADNRRSWYRNFTFSIGTRSEDLDAMMTDLKPDVAMAIGARTRVLDGTSSKACVATLVAFQAAAQDLAEGYLAPDAILIAVSRAHAVPSPEFDKAHAAALEEYKKLARAEVDDQKRLEQLTIFYVGLLPAADQAALDGRGTQDRYKAHQAAIDELLAQSRGLRGREAKFEEITPKLTEKCSRVVAARRGFVVDVAGAAAWNFPAAEFEEGDWIAGGAWLTVAHVAERHSLVGLGRFVVEEPTEVTHRKYLDAGAQLVLARDKYAGSLEVVYRGKLEGDGDTHNLRVALAAEYRVRGDSWLTITFGKDFAAADTGSLFTLANLTWGFGKPAVKLPAP